MSKIAPANRSVEGPFDVSEVRLPNGFVNLGSLIVIPADDLSIKVEVDEATSQPVAVTLECANSVLQVVAFAAPISEGLWAEIQEQLTSSISSSGGAVKGGTSALGPYLLAEIPQPDGPVRRVKFIGVDGPRWFLRGTVTGAALHDLTSSERVDDLFRSLIVSRGDAPMPPRETLPLSLPEGAIAPPRANF